MKPGYVFQTAEFESELLRSSVFQLISITVDSAARFDPTGVAGVPSVRLPKGLLLTLDTGVAGGRYTTLVSTAGVIGVTQFMNNVVVLAETIPDISVMSEPMKAYWSATINWNRVVYTDMDRTVLTAAQLAVTQRLRFVDSPNA